MDSVVPKTTFFPLFFVPFFCLAQYTDIINSNRPGRAVSAYAVGKNVVQSEVGLLYERQDDASLNMDSNILGADFAIRYGLLFEELEIVYEGSFIRQRLTFDQTGVEGTRTNFSRNRAGLKYLVFDPFKNSKRNKPNLYSWRANNLFQLKNLIPAISVYAGATFNFGDNPFFEGDPTISPRAAIATQNRLAPRFVLVSNIAYDRIGTDFPEWSYAISLTHAFRNPKWSVFVENQGIKSDRDSNVLLRTGMAYLFNGNFQADFHLGFNFKSTPSRVFTALGFSYRLDFHKDVPTKNQKPIKKNSFKKKPRKKKNTVDF